MKLFAGLAAGLVVASLAAPAFADAIPYGNVGTVAPTVDVYSQSHGITVYFDGSNAGNDNYVGVYDIQTGYNSSQFFEGHGTALGASLTLGTGAIGTSASIDAGDQLVFLIYSEGGADGTFASLPAYSDDSTNHVYITSFSGSGSIPAGIYAGFEDTAVNANSDLDYNDDSLVFTGVSSPSIPTGATPEPNSLVLLGTGLLSACGVARRKLGR